MLRKNESLFFGKFFYLFTREYCFSHYIAIAILAITGNKLLYNDWRGYLATGFSFVWIADIYMGLFGLMRIDTKKQRIEAIPEEKSNNQIKDDSNTH